MLTAITELSTLSLHDALPILVKKSPAPDDARTFIIELTDEGHEYTKRAYTAQNRRESQWRSEEHTSELQSRGHLVCRLLLEKRKNHRSVTARSDSVRYRLPYY